ncbi:MAG TPA: ATP-binding cassette domain-containing protein, partial [Candidatus Sumerlaeota bacterium]|nr:ATP-binding cassette domain-containing protein [Candidatus Sumerlaeota bacterium]
MISPHSTNGPLLNVSDLHVRFKTDEGIILAVRGVSFELGRNVALGLVGESGCGKSVTALSIMRLVPDPPGRITGGSILWKGSDILSMPRRALPAFRGHDVAMIFQEPMTSLNPVFTIGRQLEKVISFRYHLRGKKAADRIVSLLEMVGISDP